MNNNEEKKGHLNNKFLEFVNANVRNRREFLKYLGKIHASEVFSCWMTIKLINNTLDLEQKKQLYIHVYNRFLNVGSSEHINLNSDMINRIENCFNLTFDEELDLINVADIFSDIQNELTNNMSVDTFKKFLDYKNLYKIKKTESELIHITDDKKTREIKILMKNEKSRKKNDIFSMRKTISFDDIYKKISSNLINKE